MQVLSANARLKEIQIKHDEEIKAYRAEKQRELDLKLSSQKQDLDHDLQLFIAKETQNYELKLQEMRQQH